MTFLSKLGSILARVAGIALGIGPIIQPFLGSAKPLGVAVNDLTSIAKIVVQAEALIQGSGLGAARLAAATPLVAQIIQTSEMVAGHKISNETLFIQGAQNITSGIADILNAIDSNAVETAGQPLTSGLPATK